MRHRIDHRKLGRTTEHRIAMLRNQTISLVRNDRIKTTLPKAKELRRFVERLITLAKKDTLHARRLAARHVHDPETLKKLFSVLGPLYAQRPGGYTRIMKLGFRRGDGAQEAIIELVDREPEFEEKPVKGKKKAKAPKDEAETPVEESKETPAKKKRTKAKPKASSESVGETKKKPRAKAKTAKDDVEASPAEEMPEEKAAPAEEAEDGSPEATEDKAEDTGSDEVKPVSES